MRKGQKNTEESRKKMSESRKLLFKKGYINPMKGKGHIKIAKQKMKEKALGRKASEETKKKLSLMRIGNKFRLGIPNSKETREKISKGNLGKRKSESHKENIRKAIKLQHQINPNYGMKGKKFSEESINKMVKIKLGKNNPMFGKGGILSPTWQGGKSFEPYTTHFNKYFKQSILQRDGFVCFKCGMRNEDSAVLFKRGLAVHHINYDKKLTIPENCCVLCIRCNAEVNSNRNEWTTFFQSILSKMYNYKYEGGMPIINIGIIK